MKQPEAEKGIMQEFADKKREEEREAWWLQLILEKRRKGKK